MPAHTSTTSDGEQFISAVYQLGKCGCQVNGGGTLQQPIRIDYCPLHKAAPDLLAILRGFLDQLPEYWGDYVEEGDITLTIPEDVIHMALAAMLAVTPIRETT